MCHLDCNRCSFMCGPSGNLSRRLSVVLNLQPGS
jgi:hypothetical protein